MNASSLYHLRNKEIPCLTVRTANDINDVRCTELVEKMIERHPPPKIPEVIGESSKGDMHHAKAWERASVRSAAAPSSRAPPRPTPLTLRPAPSSRTPPTLSRPQYPAVRGCCRSLSEAACAEGEDGLKHGGESYLRFGNRRRR